MVAPFVHSRSVLCWPDLWEGLCLFWVRQLQVLVDGLVVVKRERGEGRF
jgi:hypothetical protein